MKSRSLFLASAVAFLAVPVAFGWTPMEPARRTLMVLVHGINPPQGGLFEPDQGDIDENPDDYKCSDESGAAHIWRTHGLSPFLRSEVTDAYHLVYAQAFRRPNDSPVDLAGELADRNTSFAKGCGGKRLVRTLQDGAVQNGVINVNHTFEMKSFFEQATFRWFEGELLEMQADVSKGDPEVAAWIQSFRDQNGGDPTLEDIRNQRPDLVPSRFIVIVHSMGGLTTREYIHSDRYAGDIDKLITLDTPHEGSHAVSVNKELASGKFVFKSFARLWEQAAVSGAVLALTEDPLLEALAKINLSTAFKANALEVVLKTAIWAKQSRGYGAHDGANLYVEPGSNPLAKLNNKIDMFPNGFPQPAYRLFHHEGVASPGNPEDLLKNNWFSGFIPFIHDIQLLQGLILGLDGSYEKTTWDQQLFNVLLSGIFAAAGNINQSEQGTIVVPAASSKGENIPLFNQSEIDLRRQLFSIKATPTNLGEQSPFVALLNVARIYALNEVRTWAALQAINLASKTPGLQWLKTTKPVAAFAITMATEQAISLAVDKATSFNDALNKISKAGYLQLLDPSFLNMFSTHDYATIHSHGDKFKKEEVYRHPVEQSDARDVELSYLEEFLYEKPYTSLEMARDGGDVFVGIARSPEEGEDPDDWTSRDPVTMGEQFFELIDYTRNDWQGRMAAKEEEHRTVHGTSSTVRYVTRYLLPNEIFITTAPKEFRFIVDDLQPQSMNKISISFNYGAFELAWLKRQEDENYEVYRKLGSWELFASEVPSPISERGEWIFHPEDYLRDGENISLVVDDGQNAVSLSMTNRAGYSNNQRFFLMFQATAPLIEFPWVKPFIMISNPRPELQVEVYSQRYPGITVDLEKTGFRIYPRTEDGTDDGEGIAYTPFSILPEGAEEPFVFRHQWAEGESIGPEGKYWLEVRAATESEVTGQDAGVLERRIAFVLDHTPPTLTWNAPQRPIHSGKREILKYEFSDPTGLNMLQGGRFRLYNSSASLVHEFAPLGNASAGGGSVMLPVWTHPEGLYTLSFQARDAAVPDPAGVTEITDLFGLIGQSADGVPAAGLEAHWNGMLARTLENGRAAYNFSQAETEIFIDVHPPEIVVEPDFSPVVTAESQQLITYRVGDGSYVVPEGEALVRWEITQRGFGDEEDRVSQFDQTVPLTEPNATQGPFRHLMEGNVDGPQFPDGSYAFSVLARDPAGRETTVSDPSFEFIVDRTPPAIAALYTLQPTYSTDKDDPPQVFFEISEENDKPVNQKGLFQFTLLVENESGIWNTQVVTPVQGQTKYTVDLSTVMPPSGTWNAVLEARDWAGNLNRSIHPFSVDRLPTRIVTPGEDESVWGKIAITGLAGNPELGSGNFGSYELTWKPASGSEWSAEGLEVPLSERGDGGSTNVSVVEQTSVGLLGTWDVSSLDAGMYELRLVSRQQSGVAIEAHIVAVQVSAPPPDLRDFEVTLENVPAEFAAGGDPMLFDVLIRSVGAPPEKTMPDETDYTARLSLTDAQGNFLLGEVRGPLRASRFEGTPEDRSNPGYYLWFDKEGQWNLEIANAPEAAQFLVGYFSLSAFSYSCTGDLNCVEAASEETVVNLPGEGEVKQNRQLQAVVPEGGSGLLRFRLPESSTASFTALRHYAPGSEIGEDDPVFVSGENFFTGREKRTFVLPAEEGETAAALPVFGIRSTPSSLRASWDGLREDGFFPAAGTAQLEVTVYPLDFKRNTGQARTATATVDLILPAIGLSVNSASEFLLEPGSPVSSFQARYGLTGRDAWLTLGVRERNGGPVVATLFSDREHKARSGNDSYTDAWDGLSDAGALIGDGKLLEFFLEARDAPGGSLLAADRSPFKITYTQWVEDTEGVFQIDVAEDEKAEVLPDALAVKPLPKYRLVSPVQGQIGEAQDFNYGVTYKGNQKVLAYPKERFSLLVRRQREEIRFVVAGYIWGKQDGWACGVLGRKQSEKLEFYAFQEMVTIRRGEELRVPFTFRARDTKNRDYGWGDAESPPTIRRSQMVTLRILPQDGWIENIETVRDVADFVNRTPNVLKEIPGIRLSSANFIENFNDQDFPAGSYFSLGDQDARPCTQNPGDPEDPYTDDPNGNGVLDKDEACRGEGETGSFDPHLNLVDVGMDFYAGNGWRHNRAGETFCLESRWKEVGFNLMLRVPESYWDPPFGYNNLANRNMRWDPDNPTVYTGDGYFAIDGFDNNGDGTLNDKEELDGRMTPFGIQKMRYAPNQKTVNIIGGVNYTKTFDPTGNFVSPLSFKDNDHEFGKRTEIFQLGFQGEPDLGSGSRFEVNVYETPRDDRPIIIAAPQETRLVETYDSEQHQWRDEDPFEIRLENSLTFIDGIGILWKEVSFELSYRAKPEEIFTQHPGALVTLPWPADENTIKEENEKNQDRVIYKGVSGVRFGIDDGITETTAGFPSFLTTPDYVDESGIYEGFFKSGLDPNRLPATVNDVKNGTQHKTGTLSAGGVWEDADIAVPADAFGSRVTLNPPEVVPNTGITVTPEIRDGQTIYVFQGTATRPWDGRSDPHLVFRDQDQDGFQSEDLLDGTDNDRDGIVDEDPFGAIAANLIYPSNQTVQDLHFRDDLYIPFVEQPESDPNSLFQFSGGAWSLNPNLTQLKLPALSVRYMDGRPHDELSVFPVLDIVDPNAVTVRVFRSREWKRVKELITLEGRSSVPFELAYIAKDGSLTPFHSGRASNPPAGEHVLGYLDVNRLQGQTTVFIMRRDAETGQVLYKPLNLQVGEPVSGSNKVVTSLYDDAQVFFPDGSLTETQFVTVRVENASESGLMARNRLSVMGPVVEVLPPLTFPDGALPQVKIRITREELDAQGVDPSEVMIYVPDGDFLKALENHHYTFYFEGDVAACPENMEGVCTEPWDEIQVSGSTNSFSHFVALASPEVDSRDFTVKVTPTISSDPVRTLDVDGLAAGEFEVYLDDDPVFQDPSDATPPKPLPIDEVVDGPEGIVKITLLERGSQFLQITPLAANAKVASIAVTWSEDLNFAYGGASTVYLNGSPATQTALAVESNQPGEVEWVILQDGEERHRVTFNLPEAGAAEFIWDGETETGPLEAGRYQTLVSFTGTGLQSVQLQGPGLIADYTPPIGALEGEVILETSGATVNLNGSFTDNLQADAELGVKLGFSTLLAETTNESPFNLSVSIDESQLQDCLGCVVKAEMYVSDEAGNQRLVEWTSRQLIRKTSRKLHLDPHLLQEELVFYPVRLRLEEKWGFDFNVDPNDLYAVSPAGERLPLELEFYDAESREGAVWVTLPVTGSTSGARFELRWAGTAPEPDTLLFEESGRAFLGIYHFNQEDLGRDDSRLEAHAAVSDVGAQPGILGTALAFDGSPGTVEIPFTENREWRNGFSFSAWIKVEDKEDLLPEGSPLAHQGDGQNTDWEVALKDGSLEFTIGGSTLSAPWDHIVNGVWNHVVCTYQSGRSKGARVYVNGILIKEGDLNQRQPLDFSESSIFLGSRSGSDFYKGLLDEVRLSHQPHSKSWVRLSYETQKPLGRGVQPSVEPLQPPEFLRWIDLSPQALASVPSATTFPVKVELNEAVFPLINFADPASIAFADKRGNLLPFEVEQWNTGEGRAVVWVGWPVPASRIAFLYTSGDAIALNYPSAVWDGGFGGVWHLDAGAPGRDAIGEAVPASVVGGISGEGQNGSGLSLEPGDRLEASQQPSGLNVTDEMTLEAWVRLDAPEDVQPQGSRILSQGKFDSGEAYSLSIEPGTLNVTFQIGGESFTFSAVALAGGGWHHLAVAYRPGVSGRIEFFLDGFLVGIQYPGLLPKAQSNNIPLLMGGAFHDPEEKAFKGGLDEVRVHREARGPRWMELNYRTQSQGNALLLFGDETPFDSTLFDVTPQGVGGLIALYDFQDLGGFVQDLANVEPAVFLQHQGGDITFIPGGGAEFSSNDHQSILASAGAASKISGRQLESGELSLEMWLEPESDNLTEGRLVAYEPGDGTGEANWSLVQTGNRLRWQHLTENGSQTVETEDLLVSHRRIHLVVTADGQNIRVYADGDLVLSEQVIGVLPSPGSGGWDEEALLVFGNRSSSLDLPWEGSIYSAAVYDQSLTQDEVLQRYNKGGRSHHQPAKLLLGVANPSRVLPVEIVDGPLPWTEDRTPDGNPMNLGGQPAPWGLSAQTFSDDNYGWILYDLGREAEKFNLTPISLTGVIGVQDGSAPVEIVVKTSPFSERPLTSDWLLNTNGVAERLLVREALQPVSLALHGANWLWIGVRSLDPDFVSGQAVLGGVKLLLSEESVSPFQREILVNTTEAGAGIGKDVYDFPVLVRLNEANFDFSTAAVGGGDLRFISEDLDPLNYEIEYWDAQAKEAAIWVRLDVPGNAVTRLWMEWGGGDLGLSDGSSVFSTDNGYAAVYHLNEIGNSDADGYRDATANGLHGTGINLGEENDVLGMIGFGQSFNGYNQYIKLSGTASGPLNFPEDGHYTVSAWAYLDRKENVSRPIVTKGIYQYGLRMRHDHKWEFFESKASNYKDRTIYPAEKREWVYLTGVRDGNKQYLYMNGVVVDSTIYSDNVGTRDESYDVRIAHNKPWWKFFKGKLDEVRFSNVARSPEWIKLSYANQRLHQSLVVVGPEDYSQWTQSKTWTVNTKKTGADVNGSVSNFPVLLRLDETNFDFSEALPQGQDLRVTNGGGFPLEFEIESWDASSEKAAVWVLLPEVKRRARTDLVTYWGNDEATSKSRSLSVFHPVDNFAAVWHLGNQSADDGTGGNDVSYPDATGLWHGTGTDLPPNADVSGIIGPATTFDGALSHIDIPQSASGELNLPKYGIYTLSAWAKTKDLYGEDQPILSKGEHQYAIKKKPDGKWEYYHKSHEAWEVVQSASGGTEENKWTLVTGVQDGGKMRLYVNGVKVDDTIELVCQGCSGRNESFNVNIGRNPQLTSRIFKGLLDEVRVSTNARSGDWIRLNYQNQKADQNLIVEPDKLQPGRYQIKAVHSGKCLDVYSYSTQNGGNIQQYGCHNGSNQKFDVTYLGNGLYKLIAVHSGKAMKVYNHSAGNGANVVQWSYQGWDSQKFYLVDLGNDKYAIEAFHSGKTLDVYGASTADKANVVQWEYLGSGNQQWRFLPVE